MILTVAFAWTQLNLNFTNINAERRTRTQNTDRWPRSTRPWSWMWMRVAACSCVVRDARSSWMLMLADADCWLLISMQRSRFHVNNEFTSDIPHPNQFFLFLIFVFLSTSTSISTDLALPLSSLLVARLRKYVLIVMCVHMQRQKFTVASG